MKKNKSMIVPCYMPNEGYTLDDGTEIALDCGEGHNVLSTMLIMLLNGQRSPQEVYNLIKAYGEKGNFLEFDSLSKEDFMACLDKE